MKATHVHEQSPEHPADVVVVVEELLDELLDDDEEELLDEELLDELLLDELLLDELLLDVDEEDELEVVDPPQRRLPVYPFVVA